MEKPVTIVIENTCRTCMVQDFSNEHIPLFHGALSCQLSHPEILEEVLFFNLGLWENDGLPQQLCISCFDTFTQISEFRKQCNAVQDNLSVYRSLMLKANEKLVEDCKTECLTTDSVSQDNHSSVGEDPNEEDPNEEDPNEDDIGESLFREYIEEDYTMDFEENKDFGLCIEEKKIAVGNEEIKELHGNDITEEVIKSDHTCNFCRKDFFEASILLTHIKKCPNRIIVICDYCTLEFESNENLKTHLTETHSDGRFVCIICGNTYDTAAHRNSHIRRIHGEKDEFKCFSCSRVFDTAHNLKRHAQRVHTIIENQCSICGKEFTNIHRYQYHMESHNPKKKFQCQYCDKSFMQIHHKINHETVHTGERPHLCPVCGKSYKYPTQLKMHMSRHEKPEKCQTDTDRSKEKSQRSQVFVSPYQCNICGKFLSTKQTLEGHMNTHTDTRPIQCDLCDRTWRSKGALQLHKYRIHRASNIKENISTTDERRDYPFSCSICSKGFLVGRILAEHMKVHSEDRKYVCKECGSAFKRKAHLDTHIRHIHIKLMQFSCDLCDKKFVSKGELKGHKVTHFDEKPFKCSACPFAFKWKSALRVHERIHTGEKPFACEVCDKRFANTQSVLYHSMFHTDAEKKIVADKILETINNQNENGKVKDEIINVDS